VVGNNNVATFIRELARTHRQTGAAYQPGDYSSSTSSYAEKARRAGVDQPYAQSADAPRLRLRRGNPIPAAATSLPPAAADRHCASTSASPCRRLARIAPRAPAPPTCSASGPATPSPPSVPSAISTSSPRRRRPFTSAAAPAWPRSARISHLLKPAHHPPGQVRALKQEIFYRITKAGRPVLTQLPHRALRAAAVDQWTSYTGYIHEVVREQFAARHATPRRSTTYAARPAWCGRHQNAQRRRRAACANRLRRVQPRAPPTRCPLSGSVATRDRPALFARHHHTEQPPAVTTPPD
jgi:hypothetical protein